MNTEDYDMNENQLWIALWKIVGAVAVVMTVSIGSCTANQHYQTRMLIENTGVDPIGAKCAIAGESSDAPICIQRAARLP